jgi:hypothetical protein
MAKTAPSTVNSSAFLVESNKNPFPNEDIDPKIKNTPAFGMSVAKAIYYRSLYLDSLNVTKARIKENRDYASGRQDINQYMPMLNAKIDNAGDKSFMNIDWSISSPASKYVNILVGDMINQDYEVQLNSIDAKSRTRKEEIRDEYYGKMIRKKDAMALEAQLGTKLENFEGFLPKDQEEIDMYMDMELKEPIEIAMEEIIDWELYTNEWDAAIKSRLMHDLVENNKAKVRLYFDENYNIKVRYVDIYNYMGSFTDDPFSNNTEYDAELCYMTIRELRRLAKGTLTEEALFNIAKMSAQKFENGLWNWGNDYANGVNNASTYLGYDDFRVQTLDFCFYTTDVYKYEEKTRTDSRVYFSKKDYNYEKQDKQNYNVNVVDKNIEQTYTGIWVIGTGYIAAYGREKNITRKVENGKMSPKVMRKFISVEPNKRYGSSQSLIDQIKPNLDAIQISTLKMRHFIAESVPPGLAIDYNSLNSMNVDGQGDWKPLDLIRLYKQKGIMLYDRTDDNGDPVNGRSVDFLQNGLGDGLRPFMEHINFELTQVASITGINEARDGSKPDKDALVGVQKLMLIASNNATRELYYAYTKGILERTATCITRMVQDKIKFGPNGIDMYIPIIGAQSVESLMFIPDDLTVAEFGIKTEALPTGEELQRLDQGIQAAVASGEIRFEDGEEIRNIKNIKKAIKYLKWRKKKYQEEVMQQKSQSEQIIMEREQAAIQASAQKEQMALQAVAQKEMAILEKQHELQMAYDAQHTQNLIMIEQWKGRNKIEEIKVAAETNLDDTKSSNPQSPQPKVFPGV